MNIEEVPIKKIKAAEYNPRIDLRPGDAEYDKLKKSIDEFDCVEPLVYAPDLLFGNDSLSQERPIIAA
jgi:ParB-like chromosome segregation protein Spo0J